jgi:hypothetical protein
MFDKNLSLERDYHVWGLTEAAVVCGETTTDDRIAERYLQQLSSEDRALAEDRIAEKRGGQRRSVSTVSSRPRRLMRSSNGPCA